MDKGWHGDKWRIRLETSRNKKYKFLALRLHLLDEGIQLHWSIPNLFSIFLTISHPILDKIMPKLEKEIGINWNKDTLYISLWSNLHEWARSDPWWWGFKICPVDLFCGRAKYSEENKRRYNTDLVLPEGVYQAGVVEYDAIWKRQRFAKNKVAHRYDLTFTPPVPIPGKGESSWDLDDDAILESTITANSLEEAIRREKTHIVKSRWRHGGANWMPEHSDR